MTRVLKFVSRGISALILIPMVASAATVGTLGSIIQGQDAFGTAVGVYGTVDIGNHEESGSTLSDLVGQGGNAITVRMSDDLAKVADFFTITSYGGSCGLVGTQNVFLNATTAQQVCSQIHAGISQGCSWRGDGAMDIVVPFLCSISNWEFLTGVVPASATTVNITGVTDAEAANVDFFNLNHHGTMIQAMANTFDSVTNGAQLAAAIHNLSHLINVAYNGTTLTITSSATGPWTYSNLQLEYITDATISSVEVSALGDASAAAVNEAQISLDNVGVDNTGLDYSTANDVVGLATLLNTSPTLDVTKTGPDSIKIASAVAGHIVFTNVALNVRPVLGTSAGMAEFLENDNVLVDPDLLVSHGTGSNLQSATGVVSPFIDGIDQLSFTPVGGITGSLDGGGALSLTGNASAADYQAALRSIVYESNNDDPPASVNVEFRVHDGSHFSEPVSRTVNITPQNDKPVVTVNNALLNFNEGDVLSVDNQLTLADPDHTSIQTATISITTGFQISEDILQFANAGGISGVYSAGTMTLTGPATLDGFRDALRNVKYKNLSEDPDESLRTITFMVHDGSHPSAVVNRSMTVTAVNDPAVVDTSAGHSEYGLSKQIIVDANIELEDIDNTTFEGASVAIIGGFMANEDILSFTNQNAVTSSYDSISGILSLSGTGTLAEYESALRSVSYLNTSNFPDLGMRTVSFTVNDGSDDSNTATKEILMPIFADDFEDQN